MTTAICILGLIGALGLAVDVGRAFITKGELQVYVDSAALAATMELDGTSTGILRAREQVAANTNKWNLATSKFSGAQVSFSKTKGGPWDPNPVNPNGYLYANVTAQVELPLYFMPAVRGPQAFAVLGAPAPVAFLALADSLNVNGNSAAGQDVMTSFGQGVFPFSPLVHDTTGPHYGLTPGGLYTLRWPANPKLNQNVCSGDNIQSMIDLANAGGGSERGYIQDTSASAIRADIEYDQQDFTVTVGQPVTMTGGAKEAELNALITRVQQDTDSSSETYEDYMDTARGNGRRIVGVPINTGYPSYIVEQIGAFFLLPANSYDAGGNSPFCAEYLGAWVQGAKNKGAAVSGAYVVRLVK
jgi:Putative Flp pilus-assembly TadE/G-like